MSHAVDHRWARIDPAVQRLVQELSASGGTCARIGKPWKLCVVAPHSLVEVHAGSLSLLDPMAPSEAPMDRSKKFYFDHCIAASSEGIEAGQLQETLGKVWPAARPRWCITDWVWRSPV